MAKKRLLTFSSDGRWRKQIDGVMRYFGRGKSVNDLRSYREAEKRYLLLLAEQETTKTIDAPTSTLSLADAGEAYLQYLHSRVETAKEAKVEQGDRDEGSGVCNSEKEDCRKQEGLSPESWARSKATINLFVNHFDDGKLVNAVSALDLDSFRRTADSMRKKNSTKAISRATVKSHVAIIAHFLGWCYRRELIDRIPRNLSEFVAVSLPPPRVKVFSVSEVQSLWSAASSRTRLYMALALNCGFGQSDISDLAGEHWDQANDIITHPRAKTKVVGKFRLWPITAALLREHTRPVNSSEDSLLVGENDLPLVHSELVNGKLKKTDVVRSAFARVQASTGINGNRGFYTLRKTAASEIERINPMVTGMFLAHSQKEMKKHYAIPHWDTLDAAVAELGRRFPFLM